jgi:hypothetical protein
MKVFELSKELNIENKELIKIASNLDIEVKSHLSVLTDEQVEIIRQSIGDVQKDEVKAKTETKVENIKKPKAWKPDLTRMICIKNIAKGKLIYKSKRQMGYTIVWDKRGALNYMELGEFINLKNSDMRFITEPWIRIMEEDEVEILKYANVYQYFKSIIEIDDVDALLRLPFDKFCSKFDKLPDSFKKTVAERAKDMIANGELDSIKIKKYIEQQLDIELEFIGDQKFGKKNNTIEIR